MNDWTPAAREELERVLGEHHARLLGTGVDADEVIADLRRHVETELGQGGAAAVGVDEVRVILRRLIDDPVSSDEAADERFGTAAQAKRAGVSPRSAVDVGHDPVRERTPRMRRAVLHWVFLVILPAITLGFELITGLCATELFDPIGSVVQVLAVASVPLVFGTILVVHGLPEWSARLPLLRVAAALATGVCGYYAVQFVPLVPVAGIAIIFFGLGLLPLSPLLAFAVSFDVLVQLRRLERVAATGRQLRAVWPWALVGLMALVAVDLSSICASLGMRWYESADPAVQARGLALLRSGLVDPQDIDHPWRMSGLASGTSAILGLVTGSEGRIFGADFERMQFAATGAPRNLADPDLWRRTRGRGRAGEARWNVLGDLSLDGSRLDGSIDPDLLYGYVEWTMTLRNSERWPLEGRATLQLPPGGVVSRVTLWIDGEEREAAFAGRAAATKAYEAVAIVQRRDPILVTTAGPDRVRLRCFPVPASGEMKFRLGITFPLRPTPDAAAADVALPSIVESNFLVPPSLQHHLWLGRTGADSVRVDDADTKSLRAPAARDALPGMVVRVRRDVASERVLARGIDETAVIRQELRRTTLASRRVTVVMDGNPRVLRDRAQEILEGLAVEVAGGMDLWLALERPVHRTFATAEEARAFLAGVVDANEVSDSGSGTMAIPPRGGFDNGPALAAALAGAALEQGGGVVLWLHGPQVAAAGSGDAVRQVLERTGGRVQVRAISVVPGRNDLIDALDGRPEVHGAGVFSVGLLRAELARSAGHPVIEVVRASEAVSGAHSGATVASTRHLSRLWAAGEATRLMAKGPGHQAEAVALAVKHQLVTSVSGAVVLETKAQYDAHGLQPVDPASVPSVPETGSLAVLAIAVLALGAAGWVRRRRDAVSP